MYRSIITCIILLNIGIVMPQGIDTDKCIEDLQTFDLECVACSCIPQLCDMPDNCYTGNINNMQTSRRIWRGVYKNPIRATSVLMGNTAYGRSVKRQKMLHDLRRMDQNLPNLKESIDEQPPSVEFILGQHSNVNILRLLVTPLAFRSITSSRYNHKLKNQHKRTDVDAWYGKKKLFPFMRINAKSN